MFALWPTLDQQPTGPRINEAILAQPRTEALDKQFQNRAAWDAAVCKRDIQMPGALVRLLCPRE